MCRLYAEERVMNPLREAMRAVASQTKLEIRVWSPEERSNVPTSRSVPRLLEHTPRAVLQAIRDGIIRANPLVVIGNRRKCESLAENLGSIRVHRPRRWVWRR